MRRVAGEARTALDAPGAPEAAGSPSPTGSPLGSASRRGGFARRSALAIPLLTVVAGLFVFLAIGAAVGARAGSSPTDPTFGTLAVDRLAARLADDLFHPGVIWGVRILTDLGGLPITALVLLATTLWARRRDRGWEGLALLAGLAVTFPLVHLAKAGWSRPRPLHPHKVADGFAYPSGHAAYAVAFVACALILGHGRPPRQRWALLLLGCGLTIFVAASRVYLRAHHASDVLGGIALAAAVMAGAWGVGAVRHNSRGVPG